MVALTRSKDKPAEPKSAKSPKKKVDDAQTSSDKSPKKSKKPKSETDETEAKPKKSKSDKFDKPEKDKKSKKRTADSKPDEPKEQESAKVKKTKTLKSEPAVESEDGSKKKRKRSGDDTAASADNSDKENVTGSGSEKKSKTKTKKAKTETVEESEKPEKKTKKQKASAKDTQPSADESSAEPDGALLIKVEEAAADSDADQSTPPELLLSNYKFSQSTLDALQARGIKALFPIQAASYSHVYNGKDVLGRARTGTGKTLAFALPIVERLKAERNKDRSAFDRRGRAPRALIMTPTRELALQIARDFECVGTGEIRHTCVYGGVPYDTQYYAMRDGVDVVIGTPGRLIDHVERGNLKLAQLQFICLDEADQMLDIGFADAMDKILQQVDEQKQGAGASAAVHQTLLFSATLPVWITQAVKKYMKPDKVTIDLIGNDKLKTNSNIGHLCVPSRWQNRTSILGDIVAVYGRGGSGRTMIFVETKGEASELGLNEKLANMGTQVIHGDVQQKQREVAMQGFREGKFRVLVATNVCARGVDIPEVDLVINCEPPGDVETYIHRSGRTGRAGKSGTCITFYKPQQEYLLQNISRRAGVKFTTVGAPQPSEIISARAADTLDQLPDIHPSVLDYFKDTAKHFLNHYKGDGEKALCAALALYCNTTKPLPARSLLTANEGFMTLLFRTANPIQNAGYVRAIVQRQFPALTYEDTGGWRITKDYCGVVVDIVSDKIELLKNEDDTARILITGIEWRDGRGVTLEILKELPELEDKMGSSSYGRGGRGGASTGGARGGYGRPYTNGAGYNGSSRGGSFGGSRGRGAARGGRGRAF